MTEDKKKDHLQRARRTSHGLSVPGHCTTTAFTVPCRSDLCVGDWGKCLDCKPNLAECTLLPQMRDEWMSRFMKHGWIAADDYGPDSVIVEMLASQLVMQDYAVRLINQLGGLVGALTGEADFNTDEEDKKLRAVMVQYGAIVKRIQSFCKDLGMTPRDRATLGVDIKKMERLADQLAGDK